jgi:hypothetical protein
MKKKEIQKEKEIKREKEKKNDQKKMSLPSLIFPLRHDPNQCFRKIIIFLNLYYTFSNLNLPAIPKWG